MSRIYTSSNKIRFTEISEKYKADKTVKGKLSELHAMLITYVSEHFTDTNRYKQKVVDALNIMTYAVYANEPLPFNWSAQQPFTNMPDIDEDIIESTIGDIFLTVDAIDWNIAVTFIDEPNPVVVTDNKTKVVSQKSSTKPRTPEKPAVKSTTTKHVVANVSTLTPKEDLYIQSPAIPQFDYNQPWISAQDGPDKLVIYTTLPIIPTKQNEISCTTDVSKMTYDELLKLYPNHLIHTRSAAMYQPISGLDYIEDLGTILPICEYTLEQRIDNIIKYPHIFRLMRKVDNDICSFYTHIEIGGQLKSIIDVWNNLPESKIIPYQADFVKEYVVRRYLLERDIKGIHHTYPIYGTLDPFLTLFMTIDDYSKYGYNNAEELAKMCVLSRVSYKQSRNPILRRLESHV